MRILELGLLRYGPFTDVTLDLAPSTGRLQVVLGRNEAGKSTTLRAVTGLLYGIAERTPDAHVHSMPDLRLGARLRASSGAELAFQRRKGRQRTLLAADGKTALDEAALLPFLEETTEQGFELGHGLDAARLRLGGKALLESAGNAARALFDASTGGLAIHELLTRLEAEADELFRPRAPTSALKKLIAEHAVARERVGTAALRAAAWREQEVGLERARATLARLEDERARLREERGRLERELGVLPLLSQLAGCRARAAALGPTPELDPDATAQRIELERALGDLTARVEVATEAARGLRSALAALPPPHALGRLSAAALDDLRARAATQRKAEADRLKLARDQAGHAARVTQALAAAGHQGGVAEAPALLVPAGPRAAVQGLAHVHGEHLARAAHAERAMAAAAAALGAARERLERAPVLAGADGALLTGPVPSVSELALAVEQARQPGEVDRRLREATARAASLRRELATALAALGTAPAAELLVQTVPTLVVIEAEHERRQEAAAARRRHQERRDAAEAQAREAAEQLAALQAEGEVATEGQLQGARAHRDALWEPLAVALMGGAAAAPGAAPAFVGALQQADGIADRLRREADRAARHAALVARHAAATREVERHQAALAALELDERAAAERWAALWSGVPVVPGPPAAMREWLGRQRAARALAEELAQVEAALATDRATRDEALGRLAAVGVAPAREGAGGATDAPELRAGLLRAEALLTAAREAALRRGLLVEELSRAEDQHARAQADAAQARRALSEWEASWSRALAAAGVRGVTVPEGVLAHLAALTEVERELTEHRKLGARIGAIERDTAALRETLSALVGEGAASPAGEGSPGASPVAAPAVASVPAAPEALLAAVERVVHEADAARRVEAERERLTVEVARSEAALRELEVRRRGVERQLAALVERAGATHVGQLPEVERRVEEARRLGLERARLETALDAAREGLTDEALAALDPGTLDERRRRREDVVEQLDRVEQERDGARADVQGLGLELERMRQDAGAASAAEDAAALAAEIEARGRRWVQVRVAAAVLERQLERFRRQHQGPLVQAASELFRELTLGRYAALRVDADDAGEAVLRAVRAAGGESVGVSGLSEGTQDQLYLALRLAALEQRAAHREPLPLLLDDAFVTFDDERTAAALGVLARLAPRCQVLLFTHHARVAELAAALPGGVAAVHRLPDPPLRG